MTTVYKKSSNSPSSNTQKENSATTPDNFLLEAGSSITEAPRELNEPSNLQRKNWTSLIKPSNLVIEKDPNNPNVAKIILDPLEQGFGTTIGSALRRILLSSLRGAAIVGAKIAGVTHEFDTTSGIREDVINIILNLKNVVIHMPDEGKKVLHLTAQGPCVVTAGMIAESSGVQVINKDQVICHITTDRSLEMQIICDTGRGYVLASDYVRDEAWPADIIPMDALFNPVHQAFYKVEHARIGQFTNYDRLIMHVETDGSITPDVAVSLAAKIAQDQLDVLITFKELSGENTQLKDKLPFDPKLLLPIEMIEFIPNRASKCLKGCNIVYIGDLVTKTEKEMLEIKNFGAKSLGQLQELLKSEFGLTLGMNIKEWPPENLEELVHKYTTNTKGSV